MLIYAKPELHAKINAALPGLLQVPFQFEGSGSQIVFFQQEVPVRRAPLWNDLPTSAELEEHSIQTWKKDAA